MTERLDPVPRRCKALILVALTGLLAACDRGVLNPAGDIARQQRDIIYISTGLMLLIIVPVMFWHFLDVVWIGVFTFVYLLGVLR